MTPSAKDDIEQAERLVRIETSIGGMRTDLARFMDEFADHEHRLRTLETGVTTHGEKIRNISKQVNTWNLANSIGALGAYVLAWFK